MGWMGWDLCAGLFYEHRFAMLINIMHIYGIRAIQRLKGALSKIALLGSYRIYLARNSDCWNPGGLIEVGEQRGGRGVRQPATNLAS